MISGKVYQFQSELKQNFYLKRFLSSAELLTLFTTPITIVPGTPGSFYIPKSVHFVKEAGTAYTLNASTRLLVRVNVTTVGFATNAGFMDQTGQLTAFSQSSGDFVSYFVGFGTALITGFNGAAISITNDTANFTLGTGGLFVTVFYEQYPMVIGFN